MRLEFKDIINKSRMTDEQYIKYLEDCISHASLNITTFLQIMNEAVHNINAMEVLKAYVDNQELLSKL